MWQNLNMRATNAHHLIVTRTKYRHTYLSHNESFAPTTSVWQKKVSLCWFKANDVRPRWHQLFLEGNCCRSQKHKEKKKCSNRREETSDTNRERLDYTLQNGSLQNWSSWPSLVSTELGHRSIQGITGVSTATAWDGSILVPNSLKWVLAPAEQHVCELSGGLSVNWGSSSGERPHSPPAAFTCRHTEPRHSVDIKLCSSVIHPSSSSLPPSSSSPGLPQGAGLQRAHKGPTSCNSYISHESVMKGPPQLNVHLFSLWWKIIVHMSLVSVYFRTPVTSVYFLIELFCLSYRAETRFWDFLKTHS